jgi:hypothetical protein
MADPITILALLAALANVGAIVSATTDVLNLRKADPVKPLAEDDRRRILGAKAAAPPVLAEPERAGEMIISTAILTAAIENIQRNVKLYADAINDERVNALQVDDQQRILTARICATLRLIRDRNDGRFPDTQVENFWREFRCT